MLVNQICIFFFNVICIGHESKCLESGNLSNNKLLAVETVIKENKDS